jgi:phage tail-like protein
MAYTKDGRSYVAGRFAFILDGSKNAGFLKSVDGGSIKAEVVTEKVGPDNVARKNLATVSYSDFDVQLGFAMTPNVYDWINASWQKNYTRKNGSIVACNFNYESMSSREFFNALITETSIPTMDGSDKNACYMGLKISPETIRYKPGDNSKVTGEFGKGEQKKWLPCNFRIEIDGLPCKKINKFDGFKITQKNVVDSIGDARDYEKEPASVEFPNVSFTLAQTDAQPWLDYFDSFVLQGNQGTDAEKTGALVFLAPNGRDELGRVTFGNMGIFSFTDDKGEAGSESIKRVKIEMYVETMALQYGGAVIK